MDKEKFINLKEAGRISGYAPDYIGQLIRQGKLRGKQIFLNTAWVTTEEAVRQYLSAGRVKTAPRFLRQRLAEKIQQIKNGLLLKSGFVRLVDIVILFFTAASLFFIVLLFYIFSVNFEKKLQKEALTRLEERQARGSSVIYATGKD